MVDDGLKSRLDAVDDVLPDDAGEREVDDATREAIRKALDYRYGRRGEIDADLTQRAGRRECIADAADHVDDPHATVLKEILDDWGPQ